MTSSVIGIDLGTTYSCVGVVRNGEVEIVANNEGKRITPSIVAFTDPSGDDGDYGVLVGEAAKSHGDMFPENVVFCAKRLIGRNFEDPSIRDDITMWPFRVVNVNEHFKYQVMVKEKAYTFYPEEISAHVLISLKSMAEDYLGQDVKKAVITVPAYFNENQRKSTLAAARIAGLEVLDLLSEPVAAAIAYGADLQKAAPRTVLVFDFGGGTFDVCIIRITDGKMEVLAVDGDPHLGGEDIDNILALSFEQIFNRKHGTQLRADNQKAWRRLKNRCEALKIQLSKVMLGNLKIDHIHEGKDLNGSLTRGRLEDIARKYFEKAIDLTKTVIAKSGLQKNDIKDILLVGGSTRIPKIKHLLHEILPDAKIPENLSTDEAVAIGATIRAAKMENVPFNWAAKITLWNVLPRSLGIGTGRGHMYIFIPANTCVPKEETMLLSTDKDNQTIIRFKVYEGESVDVSQNYFLGEFRIAGIPPAPRGVPQVEVVFRVTEDCNLHVTAKDLTTCRQKELKLNYDHERLSNEELEELIAKAERFVKHEKEVRARIGALKDLEEYARLIRTSCMREGFGDKVPEEVTVLINGIYDWIDTWHNNLEYPTVQATKDKKKELEQVWNPFITEFNRAPRRSQAPVVL